MALTEYPIIELDTIDSTNNYAMQLIDANKAQGGLTVVAQSQSAGKGQRGRTWTDEPGQSLLMTIVTEPKMEIGQQFVFNASVAVAIATVLQNLDNKWNINVKWPNDIIVNDKKAGGILIENVLRGIQWNYCVIGIGINVKQNSFPKELPWATSLRLALGNDVNITKLREDIRESIMACTLCPLPAESIMERYNNLLYRRNQSQRFRDGQREWGVTLINAHTDGTLEVQLADGSIEFYYHGQAEWDWGSY